MPTGTRTTATKRPVRFRTETRTTPTKRPVRLRCPNYLCLLALIGFLAMRAPAADASAPRIDKTKLEVYLRYIEGYTPQVKLAIDDPAPSAYKDFFRVLVHLSMGEQKVGDRFYYVSSDGQHFFSGTLWDLTENPFLDTLARLPSDGPSFGPPTAKVTIVVFSDFECPYCRAFAKTVRDSIPKKYPADVRVVFENFPIESIHPWARAAAEAAHCLADQKNDAFWAFHDWIFEHQQEVNDAYQKQKAGFGAYLKSKTLEIGNAQNLDAAKLGSCIDTHATAKRIEETIRAGRALQVQQTPTSFLNGRMIPGAAPWASLDAVIQLEMNRPKEIAGPGQEKCCEVTAPTVFKNEHP